MSCLPAHGRVDCTLCHAGSVDFDQSKTTVGDWRITFNPLSWGSTDAEVVVLGFSKGPTQAGALANSLHNEIAYKGSRLNVGKILAHVGLIPANPPDGLVRYIDNLISEPNGRFHFASLIRCTAEHYHAKSARWKGSGGRMLDRFVATDFGATVARNCTSRFLRDLPSRTKLIVMFGLGTKMNYVSESFQLFRMCRPGEWKMLNAVSYTDGAITVVHVEHFAAQGAHIPNWLGSTPNGRAELGQLARVAVQAAIGA